MVIEAAVERVDLKQTIFADLEKACRPDCILSSNTSTIDLNLIGKKTKAAGRIVGAHFFSPAHVMPLLEIVRTEHTTPQVLFSCAVLRAPWHRSFCNPRVGSRLRRPSTHRTQFAQAWRRQPGTSLQLHRPVSTARAPRMQVVLDTLELGVKIKKTPVVVGNCTGFAVNRVFFPYTMAAVLLADLGADPYMIDPVIKGMFGMPMGPFRLSDLVRKFPLSFAVYSACYMPLLREFCVRRPSAASATQCARCCPCGDAATVRSLVRRL
jgi:3-hydroxyacyl-CoA dehydrogenase, NAD binding domain/3-hydroxyacyl-CoA dehydrogenase, C-terminal domain